MDHPFQDWTDKICGCAEPSHLPKFIALTGGPGAGKTAVLEIARRSFCHHTLLLPEAASIIYGGGFWRRNSISSRKAAQRAIYYVQTQQERMVREDDCAGVVVCDRGSLDGLAYWPDTEKNFFEELRTKKVEEYAKYSAVIHLRTPSLEHGYNNSNPLRTETAEVAAELDEKIGLIWKDHPNYHQVESAPNFLEKVMRVMGVIFDHLPECCLQHHQAMPRVTPGPE